MKKVFNLKLTREQIEDLYNCISITQREYSGKKDSPMFMKAVADLRKKIEKTLQPSRGL